jgi:hypothetical protein
MVQLARASSIATFLAVTVSSALASPQVGAGCQANWMPTFGAQPGTNYAVMSMVVFDDGNGPKLYAGGVFTSAGAATVSYIARWNGTTWSSVGLGTNGAVWSLAVFDDGSGPALYAAGYFTTAGSVQANHIAKWNGSSWSALGSGTSGYFSDLAVFDDGTGPALYGAGHFSDVGGVVANNIAKWDGSNWAAVGSGLGGQMYETVNALAVFDDGAGAALYAGGRFAMAGAVAVNGIAKWTGSTWSALGGGTNGSTYDLAVFDDGGGPALYAGGVFTSAGTTPANNVAKWNGSTWSALASGVDSDVAVLAEFDDGNGSALYAAGYFANAGGTPASSIARWNGSSWSPLGSGIQWDAFYGPGALTPFDDGTGPMLYVGGGFAGAGGIALGNIAKWSGSSWSALDHGLNDSVRALKVFDDGHGPALYACGSFTEAGNAATIGIGKWNGSTWSPLGSGMAPHSGAPLSVEALEAFDDGSGIALYAAGRFDFAGGVPAKNIAKWDGTSWSPVGTLLSDSIHALAVYKDAAGYALYAGGSSLTLNGVSSRSVMKWNGTVWSTLSVDINNSTTWAMTVFDDGTGPALFTGGWFITAGQVPAQNIAKWNGVAWSALGSGIDLSGVFALAVFDDGGGRALYAGGSFATAGGVPAKNIAKWNGSIWSALGSGVNSDVRALAAVDDGFSSSLCAGGQFTVAGGFVAKHVAKWDGSSWSPLGAGTNGSVLALTVFDDSTGPALFAGGSFLNAIHSGDSYLAKWGCATSSSGTSYCTSGTTSHGCVPAISATGTASASATSGFKISVTQVEGQRTGLIFYGIQGQVASPWSAASTSFLCVKSPLQRMSASSSGGTSGLCDGVLIEDWNSYRAAHPSALGQPFAGGETVWAQGWFRDPPGLKTTKLSNGLVFAVAP